MIKNIGVIILATGIIVMLITKLSFIIQERLTEQLFSSSSNIDRTMQWFPIAGSILMISGVIILLTVKKKLMT